MELTIITPTKQQVFNITWLELNTPAGNFVIQPGRAPTVLTLTPDHVITFELKNGAQEKMLIKQGIAHITRTSVTLLASV